MIRAYILVSNFSILKFKVPQRKLMENHRVYCRLTRDDVKHCCYAKSATKQLVVDCFWCLNSLFIAPVCSNSKVESAYSTSFDFEVLSFMILVSCFQHSCWELLPRPANHIGRCITELSLICVALLMCR